MSNYYQGRSLAVQIQNSYLTAAQTACLRSLNICLSLYAIHARSIIRAAAWRIKLKCKQKLTFKTNNECTVQSREFNIITTLTNETNIIHKFTV